MPLRVAFVQSPQLKNGRYIEIEDWMPTEQGIIDQLIIGKRVVAVSWQPIERGEIFMSLEKITLEGGITLELWASDYDNIVFAEVEGDKDANS